MKILLCFALFLLATGEIAQGRLSQIWSFQQLFDEADVVIIGSVQETTKRIGTKARLEGEGMEFDNVITRFSKRAVLKGRYQPPTLGFEHYWFPKNTKFLINPPGFKQFTEVNKVYLIFLKNNSAGETIPVSGQKQAASSFIDVERDGAMIFEAVATPTNKDEQSAACQEPSRVESKAK